MPTLSCSIGAAAVPLLLLVALQLAHAMPPEWNLPSMPAAWVLNAGGAHRCVGIPASVELCADIGYSEMRLPNMLNHDTVKEVEEQTKQWVPLAKLACHREIRVLLCSIYAPVCIRQLPDRQIKPCRSLCEAVMRPCAAVMENFGFSWPEILNCTQFPPDTDLMCIKSSMDPECHACPDKVTFESVIGNYCVNKVVFKARIDRVAPDSAGQTRLHLKRRIRFFKTAPGLATRQQKRQLRKVALDTSGSCKCRALDTARANPTKKFLMMGSVEPDGSSVRVTHLVEWQPGNRDFKRAMRQIRVGKRRGGDAAVCRVSQLREPSRMLPPAGPPAAPPSGTKGPSGGERGGGARRKNKNRRNKNKKRNRKNKKGGNKKRKNRKNRRNEAEQGATEVPALGGGGVREGRLERRRNRRRRLNAGRRRGGVGGSSVASGSDGRYSYDKFYYSNYHQS